MIKSFDHNHNAGTQVSRIVRVDPDELASIAHRLKIAAFDRAYPGESVAVDFAPGLTFVYTPSVHETKVVQKSLDGGFIGTNGKALTYADREKNTNQKTQTSDPAGLAQFLALVETDSFPGC
jgi:hypothetical protein